MNKKYTALLLVALVAAAEAGSSAKLPSIPMLDKG
jgi:hypothetical protein